MQFIAGGRRCSQRWLPGTVGVGGCAGVGEGRFGAAAQWADKMFNGSAHISHFLFSNGQTLPQFFNWDRVIENPAPTVGQMRVSISRQVKAASAVCISCLSA